ncbi:hypothetical protein SLEP1_g57548 [Rubroshorea leprosula]|uniref:WRKY domain-containing protein n=1 Tax=Rubroshorea leprosula TaxID=152421 RepID=A0AAV5MLS4_9ROSI|nr:hypothetical protein SLEP1_g57548 [Rubroshorea leprosula]
MEKYTDLELRWDRNDLPYVDLNQWSPWDDLPEEKDIFKQLQSHLNPSLSPELQLFPGEEILRFYVKKLRTRPSVHPLPKLVKHSDASVSEDVLGERNTASNWIATTYFAVNIRETKTKTAYDDGYWWKKYEQKAIAGSIYPREFFRCKHHRSEGCTARKQVQRLDEDPTLFKVIHLRSHTCKQFSDLYTGEAADTTEDDSSDYRVFSRNIEAALMWTIARLDGYSWRKIAQSEDLGFKYPTISGYFRCPNNESEGCLARKCVERSDRGRALFKVTHLGEHTCKQLPRLATYEAASDYKKVSRKTIYYRCINHLSKGCPAIKQVQRSNGDPSIVEVTYEGRHTCEQSSLQLPQPAEAESAEKPENTRLVQRSRSNGDPSISEVTDWERRTCVQSSSHLRPPMGAESEVKPEKSKMVSFVRILLVANFVLELSSVVFDQLSSVHKPHYALILMLLSFASLVPCIVELVYQGRKKRGSKTRGNNNRNSFSNVAEIVGFTCAICQSILTTTNYVLLIKHIKIQINISVWPVIFAFVLLYIELIDGTDKSKGESSHAEVGQV